MHGEPLAIESWLEKVVVGEEGNSEIGTPCWEGNVGKRGWFLTLEKKGKMNSWNLTSLETKSFMFCKFKNL